MYLDGFVTTLRDYGVPASLGEALDFYRGLERGLAPDLESLLTFARLSFVRRAEHQDSFERAFAFYFYGIDLPRVAEGDPELLATPQFRDWLAKQVDEGHLPPHALWSMPLDELMRKFWETVRQQMEEHHGGNRWVGTGGSSPWGHSGNARGGVRVHGEGRHRSALKVIGERRYVDYSDANTLTGENLGQALARLRHLEAAGPRDQLDISETIRESARNGGEIELVFQREMRNQLDLILLIDNGGTSMLPHVDLTRLLFSKVRGRLHRSTTYFFHNTIYGTLWRDPRRLDPVPISEVLLRQRTVRVLILGDAAMAPEELLHPRGAIAWDADDQEASIVWLQRLRDRFPHTVWLNPIPKAEWSRTHGAFTIKKVGEVFPMEDLTLGGLKRAVERLNG